ncbi:polysaccharide pyruvyl transferase family protein [Pinibacter soli]|uniref:Polysaccharide pyruvyl transferase family protein n=1 Tax=Pinibacter soli TaxID=3044211 RepID=A0ABT6R7L5_9BACT|nr:polysaccharide pyruvyl transferase family protein [Pinibacter soli]MDI3318375.1 polysaccharide pyruvyl transferase family protein [Pinibacter soli]
MSTNRRNFLKKSGLATAASMIGFVGSAAAAMHEEKVINQQEWSRKKNPVVIIRTSWGDTNIGDQGHTPGLIALLYQYVPGVQIILWHGKDVPETEKQMLQNYPDVKIVHGKFYEPEKPFEGPLKEAFDKADLFVFNSGMAMNFGLYGHDWAGAMSGLTAFVWCREHGIPFGIYGQSFDKFEHPSMEIYRNVMSQAAFVYCRDGESLKFLQENKFRTPVLEFGPDAVFGINIRDEEKGLAYMKEAGLEEKKFLAVITLTNTPPIGSKGDPLNPVNRSPLQKKQDEDRMANVREMIIQWVRNTGYKVLLAPEANKEMQPAKEWVYDQLPEDVQSKVVWRSAFWNVSEAMSVYARAHSIFGMEPHSLIMGLTMGVPIIHAWPPSHGRKCFMFRDIGLPEWLFPVDESKAADWTNVLMQNYNNYQVAKDKVAKAMQFVHARQKDTMQVINKALQQKV